MVALAHKIRKRIKKHPRLNFIFLLLLNTYMEFARDGCMLMAAGIAFFAVFSLFPIILIGISLIGYRLGRPDAIMSILNFLNEFLPGKTGAIMTNIRTIAEDRGKIGIAGFVMLLWAGRGMFLAMEHSLNRVWGNPAGRNFVGRNLVAFLLIFSMGLVLGLSMFLSAIIAYLTQLKIPVLNIPVSSLAYYGTINKWLVSTILIFTIFSVLFRVLPHSRVGFKDVMPGAVFATIVWKLAEFGYIWYMSNMAKLSEVYGSIGGILGILLWLYIAAIVFMLASEFNIVYLRLKSRDME